MSENNTYLSIAKEDLKAAEGLLKLGLYNPAARHCQQYVEKVFKGYIEVFGDFDTDYKKMTSHNVLILADRVAELSGVQFSKDDRNWFRT